MFVSCSVISKMLLVNTKHVQHNGIIKSFCPADSFLEIAIIIFTSQLLFDEPLTD